MFLSSLRRMVWGCLLTEIGRRQFALHYRGGLHEQIIPLHHLVCQLGFDLMAEGVEIFQLQVECYMIDDSDLNFSILGAEAVPCVPKATRSNHAVNSSCSEATSEEAASHCDSDLSQFDCETSSSSDADEDLESDAGTSGESSHSKDEAAQSDNENPEDVDLIRAPPGAFVVWNNPYFSLSNYADSKAAHAAASMRARLADRWCTPNMLGTTQKSKTIQIKDYDLDVKEPRFSKLVLRAWMLKRIQENDFVKSSKRREKWFTSELKKFQLEFGAGTASERANKQILDWLPEAKG